MCVCVCVCVCVSGACAHVHHCVCICMCLCMQFVHLISEGESWTVITSGDTDQYTRTAKYMFSSRTGVRD